MHPTLSTLPLPSGEVELRRAAHGDLQAIVRLLANDPLGSSRETAASEADLQPYRDAFRAIDADPAQLLVVVTAAHEVIGTMQPSFIPGLARRGALRAQIEAVRVREDYRGQGLGRAMFDWAIGEARRQGCALVQLTTDKRRTDAHRFYDRLGFVASHEGTQARAANHPVSRTSIGTSTTSALERTRSLRWPAPRTGAAMSRSPTVGIDESEARDG